MSTVVPFGDGHHFVVGVRALIAIVRIVACIAWAAASELQTTEETNFLFQVIVFFSARAAIVG
jgi:hypothetical protein